MDLQLDDKRVLITGASRGIGAAMAKAFLAEGARVCMVSRGSSQLYRNQEILIKEFGADRVFVRECDCTMAESVDALREHILAEWGGVDIVIANIGDGRSVPDAVPRDDQWKKVWDVNFGSVLHTSRAFLQMLRNSKGCFLFVSSIAGLEAFGAPVDYSTAKTAVIGLAKNMARKLATEVRVNVLAPGNVYFEGGSWDEKIQQDSRRVQSIIDSTVPMKRFGIPEEMADAAVFLCSGRAKFITGSVLVVDGGQTVGVC